MKAVLKMLLEKKMTILKPFFMFQEKNKSIMLLVIFVNIFK